MELYKPLFEDIHYYDVEPTSVAAFLSGRVALDESIDLVAELPVSRYGFSFRDEMTDLGEADLSETTIGNPYVGVRLDTDQPVRWEVGVRLPLLSDDEFIGAWTGMIADQTGRLEAFMPNTLSITGTASGAHSLASNGRVGFRVGPSLLINTDEEEYEDGQEMILHYGIDIEYRQGRAIIGTGIDGVMIVTEGDGLAERTLHQAVLAVMADLGTLRPGIQVRIPLDDEYYRDVSKLILGLTVALDR